MKAFLSSSPEETFEAGKKYGEEISPGDVIGFKGDLGSGKTLFIKGICEYFKVKDDVTSPTFLIVNEYTGTEPAAGKEFNIYHFDLYRLEKPAELEGIGFGNYLKDDSVALIEWSELAEKYLGKKLKTIKFEYGACDNERIIIP
jgi:tRNA threonylcarbamoyladenosine biosynthesis protein TsaE